MSHELPQLDAFRRVVESASGRDVLVPMCRRLLSDQLTPVIAYRRLVRDDDRQAPSFLLESVVGGDRIARFSFLGSSPIAELVVHGHDVHYIDHEWPDASRRFRSHDPLSEADAITRSWVLADVEGLPDFTGGWVGYAAYDVVRYLEGEKLPDPPPDDRKLPDLHMQLYREVVAFDHVQKAIVLLTHVMPGKFKSVEEAYAAGQARLQRLADRLRRPLPHGEGRMELTEGDVDLASPPRALSVSNMQAGGYQDAVRKAKQYIGAGDIFQVVPSQRFELRTDADPFDLYRALRVINPSPYMFYLQVEGGMLVGSSPEILCRVQDRVVTNRPLAGTRHRGRTEAEDEALERELLDDPKDRAEHIMLVDLGRNDVGRIAQPGTIRLPDVMVIERYSHVMHISSTVTGRLRDDCDCWDALRFTLPVGTVSGAPKVRAMQIIDELEPTRRGPYAGAVGYVDFNGDMDMAIALRTMVVMPAKDDDVDRGRWIVHLQAGAGIVADSDPDLEHQETVNKAKALAKAVDLAEQWIRDGG